MSDIQKINLDLGVVILSCDKYSDLWPPFFELYFRSWDGSPFPVYLLSNQEIYSDQRVKTLCSGSDPDWSSSIKTCLKEVEHEYVWVIFDDVFFDKKVDWNKIQRLLDFLQKNKPSYLRFRPISKPDQRVDEYFGRYRENTLYRTSVFAIWKRSVLIDALIEGESAWEFEYNSPARVSHLPDFHGVYEEYIPYIHGVEKGVWIRGAVEELGKLNVVPDLSKRRQMSEQENNQRKWRVVREGIFNKSPAFLRPLLLSVKRAAMAVLR